MLCARMQDTEVMRETEEELVPISYFIEKNRASFPGSAYARDEHLQCWSTRDEHLQCAFCYGLHTLESSLQADTVIIFATNKRAHGQISNVILRSQGDDFDIVHVVKHKVCFYLNNTTFGQH